MSSGISIWLHMKSFPHPSFISS